MTALLWRLARDGGGAAAARATAAAWVFAPTWVGANTLVAFGGHFEVMALVLGGLALATGATPPTPRRAAAVGLLAGLAFWFDYAAAFAAPALLGSCSGGAGPAAGRRRLGRRASPSCPPWLATGPLCAPRVARRTSVRRAGRGPARGGGGRAGHPALGAPGRTSGLHDNPLLPPDCCCSAR